MKWNSLLISGSNAFANIGVMKLTYVFRTLPATSK